MVKNVQEYWDYIVIPNKKAYEERLSHCTAWNYSVSLYHVTDWLVGGNNSKRKEIIEQITRECPDFQILEDVCDTRKHFSLNKKERMVTEASQVALRSGGSAFQSNAFQNNACQIGKPSMSVDGKYSLSAILNSCAQNLEKRVNTSISKSNPATLPE
jgi:hypothetical protein